MRIVSTALLATVLLAACAAPEASDRRSPTDPGGDPVNPGATKGEDPTLDPGSSTTTGPTQTTPTPAKPIAGGFRPLAPVRLLDSRDGTGLAPGRFVGALESNTERVIDVSGLDLALGPAASRVALQMNVTVTETEGNGFLRVYPCGTNPEVATLNFGAGETVAGTALVDAKAQFCVFSNVRTKLVVDATGAFEQASTLRFTAQAPRRVFDSRTNGAKTANYTVSVPDLPATASGVAAHVTITEPDGPGYARVYRCGSTEPGTANLNFAKNETIATTTLVDTSLGNLCVSVSTNAHVVVDIEGTFGTAGTLGFVPQVPGRVLDSRLRGSASTTFRFKVPGAVPGTASAALHLTAAEVAVGSVVTASDCAAPSTSTSTINVAANQVRTSLTFVPLTPEGEVCVTSTAPIQLIADLVGVLAP